MVKKILISIAGIISIIIIGFIFYFKSLGSTPAPLIISNFTNLDKIEKISKYRSCTGHLVIPQDGKESRSNMKHYFWVKKEFIKDHGVEIYAPYHGYVSALYTNLEQNLEGEIWISPKKIFAMIPPFNMWNFSVQHINVREDLKLGSEVKAGELIGYAAVSDERGDSFDIVYGKLNMPPRNIDNWSSPYGDLDSVFNHMSDAVFTAYQKKGITSKDDFMITREKREQNPCQYEGMGPNFAPGKFDEDWLQIQ